MPDVPSKQSMRGALRIGAAILAVVVIAVLWGVISSHRATAKKLKDAADEQSIINVTTVGPKKEGSQGELTLPGSIQANYDAPIYARTSGYLKHWYVDIGTHVKEGQLLAEIDAPDLDQQLRQAQADEANASASQKLSQITADRWKTLRSTDSVSSQEADEKVSAAENGAAQLRAAGANLQRITDLYGFKRIVAPFDGVVTARNADVGQLIIANSSSGPELFRVADTRRLRLYVHVPQAYAAMMQPGLTAIVLFPDRQGTSFSARLDRTSNALDSSRTLLAQLIIDNSKNELLPGAYAEVHFKIPDADGSQAFKLPINTLMFRGDGVHVATVDEHDQVKMKQVNLGREYGNDMEITGGVEPNDKIIVNPPDALVDNTKVRIVPPANADKAAPGSPKPEKT